LPRVLARVFVLENLGRIDDFAKIFGRCLGASMMRAMYSEPKDLLGEVE